jgi:hypothetical protein
MSHRLRGTNSPAESNPGAVHTDVVGVLPNPEALLRLAGVVLVEANDERCFYSLSSRRSGQLALHEPIQLAGKDPLQAAADFLVALALGPPVGHRQAGGGALAEPGERDHMQDSVESNANRQLTGLVRVCAPFRPPRHQLHPTSPARRACAAPPDPAGGLSRRGRGRPRAGCPPSRRASRGGRPDGTRTAPVPHS